MTTLEELKQRHPAEVSFSGLGVWDVFAPGRRLVGRVVFYQSRPPFVRGNDPDFNFAPGFYLFPMGLVEPNQAPAEGDQ